MQVMKVQAMIVTQDTHWVVLLDNGITVTGEYPESTRDAICSGDDRLAYLCAAYAAVRIAQETATYTRGLASLEVLRGRPRFKARMTPLHRAFRAELTALASDNGIDLWESVMPSWSRVQQQPIDIQPTASADPVGSSYTLNYSAPSYALPVL